jgi:hypothetical protein
VIKIIKINLLLLSLSIILFITVFSVYVKISSNVILDESENLLSFYVYQNNSLIIIPLIKEGFFDSFYINGYIYKIQNGKIIIVKED